jgi:xylulokinase
MNLEWFRKEFAAKRSFAELDKAAAGVVPADDDPIFIPHLDGRVSPGWPDLRGTWAGLTWSHTCAHLYRAMLEGVALEYRVYKETLSETYPDLRIRELRITGGGEKSALWNRIKADVLQCRVVQIAASEGAPMGSALLAGFGVGLFKNLDKAAEQWANTGPGRMTSADRKAASLCAKRYARYVSLLEKTNQWSEE